MHPVIIIGTVRSLWTDRLLWGRYHVPQDVFLVLENRFRIIKRFNTFVRKLDKEFIRNYK